MLPLFPGVYIMLDKSGVVIYVGKAKALKNRVSSYFRGEHDQKTAAMVSRVNNFDVIVAASEFEALVLENSLIKRHQPQYNILLRDDKAYPFIKLDIKSEYPRFSLAGKIEKDGARYFGPFGGRAVSQSIIDSLCKTLKLPTCQKVFPRDIGKARPCLNHHMNLCNGWCIKDKSAQEYRAAIHHAELFMDGKATQLTDELTKKMTQASDMQHFELAAEYRDRLKAVERLKNKQNVIAATRADTDAIGFFRGAKCCFTVIHYTDGTLSGKDRELMEEPLETDGEIVSALVRQYYSRRGAFPKTILLPYESEDRLPLEQMLSEASGGRVYIEVPQRGDKAKLVEAAVVNAREESLRETDVYERRQKTLEWLQKTLELEKQPNRIEAFDISNTGSFGIVAAMTVFVCGRPLKRGYRKFKIGKNSNAPAKQDDYGSMYEALSRRFKRYLENDESFGELPDLLLIDGGANHAGVAEAVLNELGLTVPVYGMVKDDKHKTRALINAGGEEIGIAGNPAVFALVGTIQDETHRFAIEYHRSLRTAAIGSALDKIPGVGEKRRSALLKYFKTLKAIKAASLDELAQVVPKNTATAVYNHFHSGSGGDDEGEQQ